jgi:hypothetical protein
MATEYFMPVSPSTGYGPLESETPEGAAKIEAEKARHAREVRLADLRRLKEKFEFPRDWDDILAIWYDGKYD